MESGRRFRGLTGNMGPASVSFAGLAVVAAIGLTAAETANAVSPEIAWSAAKRRATIRLRSTGGYLERNRPIYVHTPPGFHERDDTCRVLFVFDGESALSPIERGGKRKTLRMDRALDSLTTLGRVHPTLLVAIPNSNPPRRYPELSPPTPHVLERNGGEAERMHGFIRHVLLPIVRVHLRAGAGPSYTGVAGCSWGGFAAAWLAYRHPRTYGYAGCSSVGLYADGYVFRDACLADTGGFTGTRFWFDSGSREGFRRNEDIMAAVRGLISRGWREGRDVAFFVNRDGGHGYDSWPRVMGPMLAFLLRSTEPTAVSLSVTGWHDREPVVLEPGAAGGRARALAEVRCADGWWFHPVGARLVSRDRAIVSLVDEYPGLPLSMRDGETAIEGQWQGLSGSVRVRAFSPDSVYERFELPHSGRVPVLDTGRVDRWPLGTPRPVGDGPCELHVCRAPGHLFCAVLVRDTVLVTGPKRYPWQQDGVEVRIDPRPPPVAALGRGEEEGRQFLFVALSPSTNGTAGRRYPAELRAGIRVFCEETDGGYAAAVLVADSVLNAYAGSEWRMARLNVAVNDFERPDGERHVWHWRPDWRSDENIVGSGMFFRRLDE